MVGGFRGSLIGGVVLVGLGLAVPDARADLASAGTAYQKHNFQSAFSQYKELAELRQPDAQYARAVVYVRGDGVDTSLTYGHAGATLAGENGLQQARDLAVRLQPRLTPSSLKGSRYLMGF